MICVCDGWPIRAVTRWATIVNHWGAGMSNFATQFAARAIPQRLEHFGEAVWYDSGSEWLERVGIVIHDPSIREDRGEGMRTWESAVVMFADDADIGITASAAGDRVFVGTEYYRVVDPPKAPVAGEWAIPINRSDDGETTRPGLRKVRG